MMSTRTWTWCLRVGLLFALASAVHLSALWALPRVIMWRVMSVAAPDSQATGRAVFPPPTDHLQRRVVMPSPDLLYALCTFDVSAQPLRIRADPRTPHYWSIALYAANSDNFFVINDRQAGGRGVDLVLRGPGTDLRPLQTPAGAQVVTAPTSAGLLLMRVLVTDYASERDTVEAARRSLQCEPLTGAS